MVNRFLMECETLANPSITSSRRLIDQVDFGVTIPKGGAFLQLNITPEKLITSSKPIEPIKGKFNGDIPDLFPLKSTLSLPQHNVYSKRTRYRKLYT